VFGLGFGGRKTDGMILGTVLGTVIVKAYLAESPARLKLVGFGVKPLAGQGMTRSRPRQTVGHPERDQSR